MKFKHVLATLALSLSVGVGVFAGVKANKVQQASAATMKTYGFLNTADWTNVYAYAWKSSDGTKKNADYPGVAATDTTKTEASHKLYSYNAFDADQWDRIIFGNNKDSEKTADLTVPSETNSVYDFENGKWAKPHSWGLCGSINEAAWADDIQTSSAAPITATSATFTVTLKAGDTFKFRADSGWSFQLDGNVISGQNGTYFMAEDASEHPNAKVKPYQGGTYTFKINWRIEAYGDQSYGVTVTNYVTDGETPWKMLGNGSRWSGDFVYANGLAMAKNPDNLSEVKVLNVNLAAGDKFKFNDGGSNWYGYTNIKAGSPLKDAFEADGTNIKVKADYAGSYSFFVDTSVASDKEAIWVTSDDYIALDGWARGFVDAEDLCDGEDEEWSTYAGYYAALDDSAKALFAANKVDADADGSYIEKAAYRYEYGVKVKNQTAFAEAQRPKAGFASLKVTPVTNNETNNILLIVVATSVASIIVVGGFLFARKRKED